MPIIILEHRLLLEQAIAEFTLALRKKQNPEIARWLETYPMLDSSELFQELLMTEIHYRRQAMEKFEPENYLNRYPDRAGEIHSAFAEMAESRPPKSLTATMETIDQHNPSADTRPDNDWLQPESGIKHKRIGDYQLLEQLGKGGMGMVFRARQISLNREVALKLILRSKSDSLIAIDRFQAEAIAVAKLDHPNIIKIHEFGFADGCWFIAMPLLPGGTMEHLVEDNNVSRDEFVAKLADVADGINHAHEQGIIHRDIKPANILLDQNRSPVVSDFGLAKSESTADMTATSLVFGTPAYFSPEQATSSKNVGPGADIYCVGVVLYRKLAGKLPFVGKASTELVRCIREEVPISVREVVRDVPRDLETIAMKCLEKEPAARYTTAAALADDLRRYLRGEPIIARPVSRPVRIYRWAKRKPMLASLIGLATLLATASTLAAILFQNNARAQTQLAQAADAKREQAVQAAYKERELRELAQAAQHNAEDATKFAEAHLLRASFNTHEVIRKAGQLPGKDNAADELRLFPGSWSIDSQWYARQSEVNVPEIHAFTTADHGLYDIAIDRATNRIATTDRSGQVSFWDIASGKKLQQLTTAEMDPESGRRWPRWSLFNNATYGFKPKQMPDFFSSVAWTDSQTLLAAGLDGRLVEFGPDATDKRTVFESPVPLHFVRFNPATKHILIADGDGKIQLLDRNGKSLHTHAMQQLVSFASHSSELNAWIVADTGGNLNLLNDELAELATLSIGHRIHDVRIESSGETPRMFIAAGELPVLFFSIEENGAGFAFTERTEFNQSDRERGHEYQQVLVNSAADQLVAINHEGEISLWKLSTGEFQTSFLKTCRGDNRPPDDAQAAALDSVESRSRWFVASIGSESLTGTMLIDCMGSVHVLNMSEATNPLVWNRPSVNVGREPRLAGVPKFPSHVWALNIDGELSYVSLTEDRNLASFPKAHAGGYADTQVLANGDIATAGNDRFIKIWRYVDGKIHELRRLEGDSNLLSVAIHEEKNLAASVNAEGKLLVWDFDSGKLRATLDFPDSGQPVDESKPEKKNATQTTRVHTGRLAFSRSGKYVAGFGMKQNFAVFDTDSFERVETLYSEVAGMGGVDICFSPTDERRMMTSPKSSVGRLGFWAKNTRAEGLAA